MDGGILAVAVITILIVLSGVAGEGAPSAQVGLTASSLPVTLDDRLVLTGRPPGSPRFEGDQVFSVRADGSDLAYLYSPPGWTPSPVRSADGQRLAFTNRRGREFHIVVVPSDGSGQRTSERPGSTQVFDGTDIAWGSDRDWLDALKSEPTTTRFLAMSELDDAFFLFGESPDPSVTAKAWLSFLPGSSVTELRGERYRNVDISLVRADGTIAILLTGDPSIEIYGSWSPDGKRIGFTATHDGRTDVFIMNADGSDLRRLSERGGDYFWLGWSPDGRRVAMQSVQAEQNALWVMHAEGADIREIMTTQCSGAFGFAWVPDGQRVAFTTGCDQPAEFWLAPVDGGSPVPLTKAIRARLD
jgi:Tol biopolymer transport system component